MPLGWEDWSWARDLNLNRRGFKSLRKFFLRKLNVMTSDCAQTFFKADKKEKYRESGGTCCSVRVRQVAVKTDDSPSSLTNAHDSETCNDFLVAVKRRKQLLFLYVFSVMTSRDIFSETDLSQDRKRCLNCLLLNHVVRNCAFFSKYRSAFLFEIRKFSKHPSFKASMLALCTRTLC